jgi:trk system potassium uptake protein
MRLRGGIGPHLNWRVIVPVVSTTLLTVGGGLLLCAAVAIVGGDGGAVALGGTALVVIPVAALGLTSARRLRSVPLRARDGFFAVTAAWVAAAAVGAVPFLIEGTLERPVDAYFETMSGFTTTGSSLLSDIQAEPDAILLWRSMTQWIGGVGIVVLVVAIAPATGLAGARVFYAETSGVTAERLTPRIAETAKIIWSIYVVMTAAGVVAFMVAGMSGFDAVNHSFTAVATGGYSTKNASIGTFDSLPIELVAIVLMIAGAINFAFYWRALHGPSIWPQAAEIRAFLSLLGVSIVALTGSLEISDQGEGLWENLRGVAFSATSISTATGFGTVDTNLWNDYARAHLVVLMFIGGSAGSTAGGMKVIRAMLLAKTAGQEIQRQLRPKAVQVLRTRGRIFTEEVRRGVLAFFFIYVTVAAVGTIAMLATGLDFITAIGSVAATLNTVGPGFGEVGTASNFQPVSEAGRVVLTMLMLAGRLEIFSVLVLFTPLFWRRTIA